MSAWKRAALVLTLAWGFLTSPSVAGARPAVPDYLPRYDLRLNLDTERHVVQFKETITWTNPAKRPTDILVVNFYPLYRIPKGDNLLLAKTLELLRLNPGAGIDAEGGHGHVDRITFTDGREADFNISEKNATAVVIDLKKRLEPGASITLSFEGTIRLPNKQGRWGHWSGISFLTNALPVVAYYDEEGWHDTPFVPWHQPFWNECGIYDATLELPSQEKLACSAPVERETDLGGGRKRVECKRFVGRDFAVVTGEPLKEYHSSARTAQGTEIPIRCLALPQHEFYAEEMMKIAATAIAVYSEWFGPYPHEQFTIAESFFGWNGNECSGLIMIDERVFDMPKLGRGYVEYLVSHETCHQWWYDLIGTNGYSETFMDEGLATYFTHKLLDEQRGRNNKFLQWPEELSWLPNIKRDNYRNSSIYGAIRRDEAPAAAGDLPGFGHLVGLFSGAYDRGSKVFGMIERRLGEAEFRSFIKEIVAKYSYRVLSAERFKAELIAYSGEATAAQWNDFFDQWVYGRGLVDWKLDEVHVGRSGPRLDAARSPVTTTIEVSQTREIDEPTVIGFQFADGDNYPIRIPVGASSQVMQYPEYDATVTPRGKGKYTVRVTLPARPKEVVIDPDRVLLDADPSNNSWNRTPRINIVPFYNMLSDTDLTNDYDRWNFTAGPWVWGPTAQDAWYTRSSMVGLRAGAYRTQEFVGGAYAAYRTDYRDLIVGADGLFDHFPFPRTQVGFNVERRIGGPWGGTDGENTATRASLFGRYVLRYGSSLYLPPINFVDVFTEYHDNFLPVARNSLPGAIRPGGLELTGLHYRLNLYTPYWDAERGVWVDLVYGGGVADLGPWAGTHQLKGEFAVAHKLPDGLGFFSNIRLAARLVAQGAFPDKGQFFALGGGTLFRGFDLAERQGSFLWVANAEARIPVARDLRWNTASGIVGGRNLQLAAFYDVGNVYLNGHPVGDVAHAVGGGVRLDVAIFSFIERATLRFDVGKTINAATPLQFWFGVQHPF